MKLFKPLLITVLLLVAIPVLTFGKYQYGFLTEVYFIRQPSARAEALGKGYSSIDGDLASIFYNPAGTATLQGLSTYASFASPLYVADNSQYTFIAAGYTFNKYLTLGMSGNHFSLGQKVHYSPAYGVSKEAIPKSTIYSLNLSSQPIKNLLIGVNTNYLEWNLGSLSQHAVYFDFGVIKKINLAQNAVSKHTINTAASISNLNYGTITLEYIGNKYTNDLPVITRYGVNYQVDINKKWFSDTLSTFKFLVHGEYQLLLNNAYHKGIHSGLELTFLEILSVRLGYYQENNYDYDRPAWNKDELSDLTYGIGLQVPFNKLTRIPLNLRIDYTNLPQPSYSKINTDWGNFSTFTFSVNWILKHT